MRSTDQLCPVIAGYILKKPLKCPECSDHLVEDDTSLAIYTDVICKACDLRVLEVKPAEQLKDTPKGRLSLINECLAG